MSIRYRRSLSSLATPLSGRVANSIRVPFFVRPPARSPVLSRNSIRKAGGMHQLVKLRYLTCLYPPPPSLPLGASAPLGLPSVTISFRSPSSRVRDFGSWQRFRSSYLPLSRSKQLENARRKVLDPISRGDLFFPFTHPAIFTGPAFWLVLLESLWYTYARSRTYFSSRVRRDTLSLSDPSLEKESFRRHSFAVSFVSYYLRDISLGGGISLSSVFIILFQLAKLPRKFLLFLSRQIRLYYRFSRCISTCLVIIVAVSHLLLSRLSS